MRPNPITVSPETSIRSLVEDYIYQHHFKMMPVVSEGRLVGCVTTKQVKEEPRDSWEMRRVGEIMGGCDGENSIGPDEDAMGALSTMNRTGNIRLMVVDDGELIGVITLKDLLAFLAMKVDLEGKSF